MPDTARDRAMEEHIRAVVESAPPLSPEQIQRLRDLLPPVSTQDYATVKEAA